MRFRAIALAVICAVIGAAMITSGATAGHEQNGNKHKVKKKKKKQQGKISICHRTGNGSFVLITVGFPALQGTRTDNHGEAKDPTNGSCEQPVEPQAFSSGPVLDFGPNGWGGWSCPLDMRADGRHTRPCRCP